MYYRAFWSYCGDVHRFVVQTIFKLQCIKITLLLTIPFTSRSRSLFLTLLTREVYLGDSDRSRINTLRGGGTNCFVGQGTWKIETRRIDYRGNSTPYRLTCILTEVPRVNTERFGRRAFACGTNFTRTCATMAISRNSRNN